MIVEQICFKDVWHMYVIEWTAFAFGMVSGLFIGAIIYIVGKK